MSIVNSFDISSKAILEPSYLAKPIENFPETVILTFKTKIIDELIKNYDVKIIDELSGGFTIMAIENKKNYYGINTLRKIIRLLDIEDEIVPKMDAYLKFLYMGVQATVKKIRKRAKMTQSEFAKELGVSRSSIREWESGKKELSRKSWEKLVEFAQ